METSYLLARVEWVKINYVENAIHAEIHPHHDQHDRVKRTMVWKITLAKMQGEDMIKGGCKVRRPAMYMYGIPVGEEQRLRCFYSAFFNT